MTNRIACLATFVLLAVSAFGCAALRHSPAEDFPLQPGDLLFQDIDCGPLCDAIETVTQGVDGAHFSHLGMVSRIEGRRVWIIEAVSAGVVETPLRAFLRRSADAGGNPKVLVGRVDAKTSALIPEAIAAARAYLGRHYDRIYTIDTSTLYCSELIYEAFRKANDSQAVFDLAPMTFKDPATGTTFPAWSDYYAELKTPIPEGQPGLNPGGISRSPHVRIVHAYGAPEGWHGHVEEVRQ